MGLEDVKMFQILSNGKIKELNEKQYLKRLYLKGCLVGYVDANHLLLSKNETIMVLRRHQIQQIFNLFDNVKEA
jgi:hypothetical protein